MGGTANPIVVRADELDQPGEVVDPKELDAPKPKMGFKKSLRAGFGLKPEGTLSDDISQIGEGFSQMYHHPFTSANDIVEGLYGSQQDVAEKGQARMKSPRLADKISGGAQYLESGIPLAGPILSRMGEQTEEGDYTGALGTGAPLLAGMDTKPFRGAVGDVARTPGGAVKPGIARAGSLAGGYLGSTALSEHPYIGAGLGYGAGRLATEMMVPERTPKSTPWETRPTGGAKPWESQSARPFGKRQRVTPWEGTEEPSSDKGTSLSDQISLMPEGGPKSYKLTPEQVPGLPELRRLAEQGDTRAQSELQRRGQQILIAPKEAGYPGAREGSKQSWPEGGAKVPGEESRSTRPAGIASRSGQSSGTTSTRSGRTSQTTSTPAAEDATVSSAIERSSQPSRRGGRTSGKSLSEEVSGSSQFARTGSETSQSTEAAPASPVSKSSKAEGPSKGVGSEKRAVARPKGTTLSDKMAKQFALEESVKDTTKRLKAEKDPTVKRHMQQQIDDFNKELKGLQ